MAQVQAGIAFQRRKRKFGAFSIINGLFFLLVCFIILIPIWKVLVDSFDLTTGYGMKLWPERFGLAGYISVFTNPTLYKPLMNSILTTVGGTFFGLMLSTLGAYVLIQFNMPGRNFLAGALLFTMIFEGGMIPSYIVMRNLGLTNSLWGVILLPAINVYNLVLMRNFFEGIPVSLFESATLDGANDIVMYAKITLPLAVPVLIIQGLGTFSLMYTDFLWPTLVVRTDTIQTLMPRLKYLAESVNKLNPGVAYAMYLLAGVPLAITSLIGLKYFINGDFASGMKL